MGFIKDQLSNVVEWADQKPGQLFWKWQNDEIKKGSVLFIRPGQDAIFLYNGKCEGIFEDEGKYDIESQIIPFLSTLKGFKFGFNSGLRSEVLFINTLEQTVKWGTKNAISIRIPELAADLPGGVPIRAFGTFNCAIADRDKLIDKLAGIHNVYSIEDVKEVIISSLDQLLMSWISKEGKDMFNLQADARNIAEGIKGDLDAEMAPYGISITKFNIESFNYPEEIKKMQEKAAAQAMIGNTDKYSKIAMADSFGKGGSGVASDMVQMQMGMMMGQQMAQQMNMGYGQPQMGYGQPMMQQPQMQQMGQAAPVAGAKFCPNCGTATNGAKFCPNCGNQLA